MRNNFFIDSVALASHLQQSNTGKFYGKAQQLLFPTLGHWNQPDPHVHQALKCVDIQTATAAPRPPLTWSQFLTTSVVVAWESRFLTRSLLFLPIKIGKFRIYKDPLTRFLNNTKFLSLGCTMDPLEELGK